MSIVNKNLFFIIVALIAALGAASADFGVLNHQQTSTISSDWMPQNYTQNVTFTVTNEAGSGYNVTKIEIWNTIGTSDPFNITQVYCPVTWSSSLSDSDSDGIIDLLICNYNTGTLTNGTSADITLTIKSMTASNSATQYGWTIRTTDNINPVLGITATNESTRVLGIDALGPNTTFIAPTDNSVNSRNITFNATINESQMTINTTYMAISRDGTCINAPIYDWTNACAIDNKTCSQSFVLDTTVNATDGYCLVTVYSRDIFGSEGNDTINITIDNTAPVISLYAPQNNSQIQSGTIIYFNVTDQFAGVHSFWWYNGTENITSAAFTIDTSLFSEGDHELITWANDSQNNLVEYRVLFRIDNTEPTVTVNTPQSGWFGNNINVNVSASDSNSMYQVMLIMYNSSGYSSTSNLTFDGTYWMLDYDVQALGAGNYTLNITAQDNAGNINYTSMIENLAIDHTKPTVSISTPIAGQTEVIGDSLSISATVSDNLLDSTSVCSVTIGGVNIGTLAIVSNSCSGTLSIIGGGISAGDNNFKISVKDLVGNEGADQRTITLSDPPKVAGSGSGGGFHTEEDNTTKTSNHAPTITAPKIDNEKPYKGETIMCTSGKYYDKDGDSKSAENFRWYVNNNRFAEDSNSFNTLKVNVGDEIYCEQRVTDGELYSEWATSENKAVVQMKTDAISQTAEKEKEDMQTGITGAFLGGTPGQLGAIAAVIILTISGIGIGINIYRRLKRSSGSKVFKIKN